jgi:hypothetical protein
LVVVKRIPRVYPAGFMLIYLVYINSPTPPSQAHAPSSSSQRSDGLRFWEG